MDTYMSRDGIDGHLYRAEPESGGVLVLPHSVGIQPEIRREAESLAREGLSVFLWDPYPGWDSEASTQPGANTPPRPFISDEDALAATSRCLDFLVQELHLPKVGLLGYCMGGRMALNLVARDSRPTICVSYYPTMLDPRRPHQFDPAEQAHRVSCPVQVLYGGLDDVTSNETFGKLRAALETSGQPIMSHIYPQAGHGFMNDRNQSDAANRQATQLAWPQTLALLKPPSLPDPNREIPPTTPIDKGVP